MAGDIEIIKSSSMKTRDGQQGLAIEHTGKGISGDLSSVIGRVYLVIDCSVSMDNDGKLPKAKKGALEFARGAFIKNYSTGLISFGSSCRHISEPQRSLAILQKAVDSIMINGSTNMAGGIKMALDALANQNGLRTMVIVTDGAPDDRPSALEYANQAKKRGIDIITIGTEDADHAFLKQLASRDDLAVSTSTANLREDIANTAKMLPSGNPHKHLS